MLHKQAGDMKATDQTLNDEMPLPRGRPHMNLGPLIERGSGRGECAFEGLSSAFHAVIEWEDIRQRRSIRCQETNCSR